MWLQSEKDVNLVGYLGWSVKSKKFPCSFHKRLEKQKLKLRNNRDFYVKPIFEKIDFVFSGTLKKYNCRFMKFSPSIYYAFYFYIHHNILKISWHLPSYLQAN